MEDLNLIEPIEDNSCIIINLGTDELNVECVFNERSRHYLGSVFFKHVAFDQITHKVMHDQITFIVGQPLSGKTRIIYDSKI
jgi:hypothetical protein